MARAVATVEDFEAGTLPSVCAKTGEVAEGFTSITVTSTPSWTWILLLFGILPFLIAQAFSSTRIVGLVPMSEVAMRRTHAFTWTYRGFLVIGAAVLAVGLATDSTVLVLGVGDLWEPRSFLHLHRVAIGVAHRSPLWGMGVALLRRQAIRQRAGPLVWGFLTMRLCSSSFLVFPCSHITRRSSNPSRAEQGPQTSNATAGELALIESPSSSAIRAARCSDAARRSAGGRRRSHARTVEHRRCCPQLHRMIRTDLHDVTRIDARGIKKRLGIKMVGGAHQWIADFEIALLNDPRPETRGGRTRRRRVHLPGVP